MGSGQVSPPAVELGREPIPRLLASQGPSWPSRTSTMSHSWAPLAPRSSNGRRTHWIPARGKWRWGGRFIHPFFYNNCMFMFVNIYSCLVNAFHFDSIWFEGIFRLNALSMHWTLNLVRPTLDATMASIQRSEVHFRIFLFVKYFIRLLLICPCYIQSVLFHPNHNSFIIDIWIENMFSSLSFYIEMSLQGVRCHLLQHLT